MRILIRLLLYSGGLLLAGYLFRRPLFYACVHHQSVGQRVLIKAQHPDLRSTIDNWCAQHPRPTSVEMMGFASEITQNLQFTFEKCATDPNQIFPDKATNCVGYSALYHSVLADIIVQTNQSHRFVSEHHIGKLSIFGIDLHQYTQSPFFKDHDFNILRDTITHQIWVCDPSVDDWL